MLLRSAYFFVMVIIAVPLTNIVFASTDTAASSENAMDVITEFTDKEIDLGPRAISTKEKHSILFFMGGTLLVLVLTTAILGISMALYGKQVFMWHMISAGLTVTLALAHGVAAVVWFFPY